MTEKTKDIAQKIIALLAEHVGTDGEELDIADMFQDDLHMSATDLADFTEKLNMAGFDTSNLDFMELETVEDLIENIISQEELN